MERRDRVLLLPGIVLPAQAAYEALIGALGADADAVAKDLEVYADVEPPPDYGLDTEVAGILREAGDRGWEAFHLVGYSGGGSAALAFVAKHPERVRTLALLEPAWAGRWDWSAAHTALWDQYDALSELDPGEFMTAFVRLNLRPGVVPPAPPPGSPPPWMAQRPAGIAALMDTFKTYDLDRQALSRFEGPVYFGLGGLSNPDQFAELADRLAGVFGDFRLEVFPERHHFDPPHRVEPERLAASLRGLWSTD